ncbi:MAG: hypothetical protein ACRDHZ_05050 [Ktedonobacteraceae bacterium]
MSTEPTIGSTSISQDGQYSVSPGASRDDNPLATERVSVIVDITLPLHIGQ